MSSYPSDFESRPRALPGTRVRGDPHRRGAQCRPPPSIDPTLAAEGAAAFQALAASLVEMQAAGLVRREDPTALATFIWATVHGVAMLVIDGQLDPDRVDAEDLTRYSIARVRDAIRA